MIIIYTANMPIKILLDNSKLDIESKYPNFRNPNFKNTKYKHLKEEKKHKNT